MPRKQETRQIPEELRKIIINIALQTDVIAAYPNLEAWRQEAIITARWLLRTASEGKEAPRALQQLMREFKRLAYVANESVVRGVDLPPMIGKQKEIKGGLDE